MNPIVKGMYEGAKALWPNLTPEDFGKIARSAISRIPTSQLLSLNEVAQYLYDEIAREFGEPKSQK